MVVVGDFGGGEDGREGVGDFGFLSSFFVESLRLRTRSKNDSFMGDFEDLAGDFSFSGLARMSSAML